MLVKGATDLNLFTHAMLKPEYSGQTRSIPSLLMPWLIASPVHQLSRGRNSTTPFSMNDNKFRYIFSFLKISSGPISHDDVIKWKHFPRYWPFVRGIHWSPVNSPHKGQWRGALMLSLICVWINGWVNNREAGDLRHYRAHYDVIVMANKFSTTI